MPTRFPITNLDNLAWGMSLNDSMRPLLSGGIQTIALNANNPPTVKAGSSYYVYFTDNSYTIPASPSTGNLSYPNSTTPTINASHAISEPSDRTFTWGSGNFPAISDGTWYLYCVGAQDGIANTGTYGATKTPSALAYSAIKGGYYAADGYRYLASFLVVSSVVSGIIQYYPPQNVGYQPVATYNIGTNQTTNLTVGNKIAVNSVNQDFSNGLISLNTGTYIWTLAAGHIYECRACIGYVNYTGIAGYHGTRFYDITAATLLGSEGLMECPQSTAYNRTIMNITEAYIDCTTTAKTVQLQITSSSLVSQFVGGTGVNYVTIKALK